MALKQYKPVTAGQRGLVLVKRTEVHKGKPYKPLTSGLTSSGGRNNHGHLTARRKGGGHKKNIELLILKEIKLILKLKLKELNMIPIDLL